MMAWIGGKSTIIRDKNQNQILIKISLDYLLIKG
jgi:hypothetical protein